MQQDNGRTRAKGPVDDFGVAAFDAVRGDALHAEIRSQAPHSSRRSGAFIGMEGRVMEAHGAPRGGGRTNTSAATEADFRYGVVTGCASTWAGSNSASSGMIIHAMT